MDARQSTKSAGTIAIGGFVITPLFAQISDWSIWVTVPMAMLGVGLILIAFRDIVSHNKPKPKVVPLSEALRIAERLVDDYVVEVELGLVRYSPQASVLWKRRDPVSWQLLFARLRTNKEAVDIAGRPPEMLESRERSSIDLDWSVLMTPGEPATIEMDFAFMVPGSRRIYLTTQDVVMDSIQGSAESSMHIREAGRSAPTYREIKARGRVAVSARLARWSSIRKHVWPVELRAEVAKHYPYGSYSQSPFEAKEKQTTTIDEDAPTA